MATSTRKRKSKDPIDNILQDDTAYIIKEASLKDDFCNYVFEITQGVGVGTTLSAKGSGIIKDDMRHAFGVLNVHLATIDDAFKHSGIEIDDIDKYHNHDLASFYHVTGIKIKGGKENESVEIIGNKYVSSAGGRIELKTPRIPLDNLSSYKWYNELKAATDVIRREVELYKEGKYMPVEVEEDPAQMTISDMLKGEKGNDDDDLENSKV